MRTKDPHIHKYNKKVKAKVVLRDSDGIITGHDTLLLHQCTCKKVRAYDLERVKLQ